MKKLLLLLVTFTLAFTLSSCDTTNKELFSLNRRQFNQTNKEEDSIVDIMNKADVYETYFYEIAGYDFEVHHERMDVADFNHELFKDDNYAIKNIQQEDEYEKLHGYSHDIALQRILGFESLFKRNDELQESKELEVDHLKIYAFLNEHYAYQRIIQEEENLYHANLFQFYIDSDNYATEHFRITHGDNFSEYSYILVDSDQGHNFLYVQETEEGTRIKYTKMDYKQETYEEINMSIRDEEMTSVLIIKKDFKKGIGYEATIFNDDVKYEEITAYRDNSVSVVCRKNHVDGFVTLSYSMRDVLGWDSFDELGFYNGTETVFEKTLNELPMFEFATGVMIDQTHDMLNESNFLNIANGLTYDSNYTDFTYENLKEEFENIDTVIERYYKEGELRIFGETYETEEALLNSLLDLLPDEFSTMYQEKEIK